MNDKRLFLVLFVALFVLGFMLVRPTENTVDESLKNESTEKVVTYSAESTNRGLDQGKISDPEQSTEGTTTKVSSKEIASTRYFVSPGDKENLTEYVDKLLQKYRKSPHPDTAMRLRRAFEICRGAPKSQEDVETRILNLEKFRAKRPGQNPHRAIINTTDHLWNAYYRCKEIKQAHPDLDFEDTPTRFLREAADMGNGLAASELALGMEAPKDFLNSNPDFQSAYKARVGDLLLGARNNCEPSAMHLFALRAEEDRYWYDQSDDPRHIKYYANLLALYLYYENNVEDYPEKKLNSYRGQLERMPKRLEMNPSDVDEAREYGRNLYQINCL